MWSFSVRKLAKVLLFPVAFVWVFRWQIVAVSAVIAGIRWWDRLTF